MRGEPGGPALMRLAAVFVHYHAGALLAEAVTALRQDLAGSGLEAELVVVDNGSDADERARMASLPVRRLDPGANVGYAAGLNRGIAAVPAEAYLLMNPDVLVLPGSVAALAGCLRDGAAAAGPRFHWDRSGRLLLPPTEERTRRSEITTALASRGSGLERFARRRWRRHARRHWLAEGPLESRSLSGALLAVRADALRAVGPFDEGYRLYFEEDDWLRRLALTGRPSFYVPAARVVHLYAQSAAREPRAAGWFGESAERFRRRNYGRLVARLLRQLAGPPRPPTAPPREVLRIDAAARAEGPGLWVEVSPTPTGFPAAAERLAEPGEEWSLPEGVREQMAPGSYLVRLVDASGGELACVRFDKPAS